MDYLAHSAKKGHLAQTYAAHVQGVCERTLKYANEAECYAKRSNGQLPSIAQCSAIWHDLGKLDDCNQAVLRGEVTSSHLPVNHVDAGVAALLDQGCLYAALAVYAHHRGLPDMEAEYAKGSAIFRDERLPEREAVNFALDKLCRSHEAMIPLEEGRREEAYEGDQALFFRMLLSCLADADHSDAAAADGQYPENNDMPKLRAGERLASLDKYVASLEKDDERSQLRNQMYFACRNAEIDSDFTDCDSPVGSGKTTAIMAHLLRQAVQRNARRIFVILPYTSIITQSVETYRKALVLQGEDPEAVVAEVHHKADFQSRDTRYLTSLWRAPIIVTTAVAFFETLASNRPAALRRLHELPGSVIFIDESHNALPLRLLPLAWQWMNVLAAEWSCYWVLASGSLVRFWQLESLQEISMVCPKVEMLVPVPLREQLMRYEKDRIAFRREVSPLGLEDLVEWVQKFPGPRLLILNTVQSAAVIADTFCCKYGRTGVEHLSTALTAEDRDTVIKRVKLRLMDQTDQDWTLVATSCIEAGVDFSFRTGFREISSLLSLLQAAGRVNRHGDIRGAEIWSFTLQDDSRLKKNPALNTSSKVLTNYLDKGILIEPNLSTRSMNDEIIYDDSCLKKIKALLAAEESMMFASVADQFEVIDTDTVTAIVDRELAMQISSGGGNWQQLQKKAVSIRREKITAWQLKEISKDIYQWTLGYDSFLGYMFGVLNLEKANKHGR